MVGWRRLFHKLSDVFGVLWRRKAQKYSIGLLFLLVTIVYYKMYTEASKPSLNVEPNNIGASHNAANRLISRLPDDIYWPDDMQKLVPKGWTMEETLLKLLAIREHHVVHFEKSTFYKCGQKDNAFVKLNNGMPMCVHHGDLDRALDEVLAFYLSLLLGMDNVPFVVVSRLNSTSSMWKHANYPWEDGPYVSMAKVIPFLDEDRSRVTMPRLYRRAIDEKFSINKIIAIDANMTSSEVSELIQWGTMTIFDYLIRNFDRVAHEYAPVPDMYPRLDFKEVKNLRKSSQDGKYWLFDNELAFLRSYPAVLKFPQANFHKDMLRAMCIFERNIVDGIRFLYGYENPHEPFIQLALRHDPCLSKIPRHHYVIAIFTEIFKNRLSDVYHWIEYCERDTGAYIL